MSTHATASPPQRIDPVRQQRLANLTRAQRVMNERAALRKRLLDQSTAASRRELARVLGDPPGWLARLPAARVLGWGRRIGEQRARRMLAHAGASESRLVGQLTQRQRQVLAEQLRGPVATTTRYSTRGSAG